MYKYKAKLISTQEIIAEANTIDDLEGLILGYRRKQKLGQHTSGNEKVEIIHVERNSLGGKHKSREEIVKVV
ncbi:MAG6790 family protein [Mycoplasmopsis adleri]|uniref:MAG6790 family protein n=1 Tax=Mycoplasmopsis adleri TaxID=51362 RepID=UPI003873AE5B